MKLIVYYLNMIKNVFNKTLFSELLYTRSLFKLNFKLLYLKSFVIEYNPQKNCSKQK